MKLPSDPKERNQILVLIGLVAIGVCVGIFFGFKQLASAKKNVAQSIEETETELKKADAKIKRMAVDKVDNDAAVKEILDISDKYILTSVLGNYQLVARDILESASRELGLKIEPVRELGQGTIPYPSGPGDFKTYTARVSMNCGMHDLIKYLHKLESENPYLSITGISITERTVQSKDEHQVSFEVQWPIWGDPAVKDKLEVQLKEDSGE